MMKNHIHAILLLITMSCSVALTACASEKLVPDISEYKTTTPSNTNETSVQKSLPVGVIPTQSSSIISEKDNITIDYNQYIKKTWVVKNWIDDNPYNYSSFYISKIADGVIEGKFLTTMIAKFNENYYLPKYKNEMVNLNGTINKDTVIGQAICQ